MGTQFLSHSLTILDIEVIFSIVSNHTKILNLTADPIIIQTLLCSFTMFLCQLTCQSADIMSSLCGVGVRVNIFSSKTTRPRDMLFFLKDTLSIEDEKLFKACKSVCSSVC